MGRIKKSKDVYCDGKYIASIEPELLAKIGAPVYSRTIDATSLKDYRVCTLPDLSPSYIDYGDYYTSSWITSTTGSNLSATITYPSTTLNGYSFEELEKAREKVLKKEIGNVKIDEIKSSNPNDHIFACQNKEDLSVNNILTTLSAVKARLLYDVAMVHVQKIECSVTPVVKDNIVKANKKRKMYGKSAPIVACFDEYGQRLPDTIDIGDSPGILLKIVDPEEYGEYYYELKAIEFSNTNYVYKTNNPWGAVSLDDLPF